MRAATTAGVVIAVAGAARADSFEKYRGAASLEYEAGYVHAYNRDMTDPDRGPDGLGLVGARLRGQVSKSWIGYRVGLDLRAGATAPGGFAYDVDLYLLGVGARLGQWSRLGITGGVGASGAVGTVDDAVLVPVEASLELALGSRIRILARGRIAWLAGASSRQDGAPSLGFADELDAALAIRFGRQYTDWGYPTGNGYFVGASYRESEGAKMIGVIIGHSLDAGTR